jgi:hypothetical protein
MELPEHLQTMFDDNVRTARIILGEEGEITPVMFMGGPHNNVYLPVDGFPSAEMLGKFLRYAVREFRADWILVVLDAMMEHQETHERGRNILWVLETKEGGHWTAHTPVVTKGRKKTFGDVKLTLTKIAAGDIAGLFTEGSVH